MTQQTFGFYLKQNVLCVLEPEWKMNEASEVFAVILFI